MTTPTTLPAAAPRALPDDAAKAPPCPTSQPLSDDTEIKGTGAEGHPNTDDTESDKRTTSAPAAPSTTEDKPKTAPPTKAPGPLVGSIDSAKVVNHARLLV